MNFKTKLLYAQNWNIGFCEQTPEELIRNKKLSKVRWLKHPYRDRWFADPFIYKVSEHEIIVFVEECMISDTPKGIICELVIDRKTMRLKKRYVMLELDTHISYPAIISYEGKDYVYPENGASGQLNIYEYDKLNHKLVNPICILDEAVADATIIKRNDRYYMSATKYPDTQAKAYMYVSESLFGPYKQLGERPYQTELSCSRQGGNWMTVGDKLFRPAQNCVLRYGAALSVMETMLTGDCTHEITYFSITPICYRYSEGLHTINFSDNLCVIDSYGYTYPFVRPLHVLARKMKKAFNI